MLDTAPAARRRLPIISVSSSSRRTTISLRRRLSSVAQVPATVRDTHRLAVPTAVSSNVAIVARSVLIQVFEKSSTTISVKKARNRRQSQILQRVSSVVFHPRVQTTYTTPPAPLVAAITAQDETFVSDEDTSMMFNDHSFDETVDPNQQSSTLQMMARTLASGRRFQNGRRIATCPWLEGLARCPTYEGDSIAKPRVRPPKKSLPRPIQQNQVHRKFQKLTRWISDC
jgi:hypothetical protein